MPRVASGRAELRLNAQLPVTRPLIHVHMLVLEQYCLLRCPRNGGQVSTETVAAGRRSALSSQDEREAFQEPNLTLSIPATNVHSSGYSKKQNSQSPPATLSKNGRASLQAELLNARAPFDLVPIRPLHAHGPEDPVRLQQQVFGSVELGHPAGVHDQDLVVVWFWGSESVW